MANDNMTRFNPSCRDPGLFKNGLACSNTKTWIRFVNIKYNNLFPKKLKQNKKILFKTKRHSTKLNPIWLA